MPVASVNWAMSSSCGISPTEKPPKFA